MSKLFVAAVSLGMILFLLIIGAGWYLMYGYQPVEITSNLHSQNAFASMMMGKGTITQDGIIGDATKISTLGDAGISGMEIISTSINDYKTYDVSFTTSELNVQHTFVKEGGQVEQFIDITNSKVAQQTFNISNVVKIAYDKIRWNGTIYDIKNMGKSLKIDNHMENFAGQIKQVSSEIWFDDKYHKQIFFKDWLDKGGYLIIYNNGSDNLVEFKIDNIQVDASKTFSVDPVFINMTNGFFGAVGNNNPVDIWGNETNIFIADVTDASIYMYLHNGSFFKNVSALGSVRALCGNSTTWIELPLNGQNFQSYVAGTGTTIGSAFPNGANTAPNTNSNVEGMWCNDTDIYISDYSDRRIYHDLINGTYVNQYSIGYTTTPQGVFKLNESNWLLVDQQSILLYMPDANFTNQSTYFWSSIGAVSTDKYGIWGNGTDYWTTTSGTFVFHFFNDTANGTSPTTPAPPNVRINVPANATYPNEVTFNITANGIGNGVSSCWYSLNGGLFNYTMINSTAAPADYTATNATLNFQGYTFNAYCNSTINLINNTQSVNFSVDICDSVITTSYTMTHDVNCTKNGINLTTSNVIFNCNNFSLRYGFANDVAVGVRFEENNITLRNCNILDGNFSSNFTNKNAILMSGTLNDNTIINNFINSSKGRAIFITSPTFINITNNTIYHYNSTLEAVKLDASHNSILANNTIIATLSNGLNIDSASSSIQVEGNFINASNGVGAFLSASSGIFSKNTIDAATYGYYLREVSNNNLFRDDIFLSGGIYDVVLQDNQVINNFFLNVSYHNDTANGTFLTTFTPALLRLWYYKAHVNNSVTGADIQNAIVTGYDNNTLAQFNQTTDVNGLTIQGNLTEYFVNSANRRYFNNYTINASAMDYNVTSHFYNITEKQNIYLDEFPLDYSPSAPAVFLTYPTRFFNSSTSNITFDCNASSTLAMLNLSLIIDGILNVTIFNTTDFENLTLNVNYTLPDGTHNWTCKAYNTFGNAEAGTRFFFINSKTPTINITFPANNHSLYVANPDTLVPFTFTINITTLSPDTCWSDNGHGSKRFRYKNDCNQTTLLISNLTPADWNNVTIYVNDTFGRANQTNFISFYNTLYAPDTLNVDFSGFEDSVTEGSQQKFYAEVFYDNTTFITIDDELFYNGTQYFGTIILTQPVYNAGFTLIDGKEVIYEYTTFAPQVINTGIANFYYPFDFIYTSPNGSTSGYFNPAYNLSNPPTLFFRQQVNNLNITNTCSGNNHVLFNLTMVDEQSLKAVNGTIEIAINLYTISRKFVTQFNTTLIHNTINDSLVCIANFNGTYSLDYIIKHNVNDSYFISYREIQNMTIRNSTAVQNITLYNLLVEQGFPFDVSISGNYLSPTGSSNLLVEAQKLYVSANTYILVESSTTAADGSTILHLIPNSEKYNFVISYMGQVLGTLNNYQVQCQNPVTSQCSLNLPLGAVNAGTNDFLNFGNISVVYLMNTNTQTLNTQVRSTDGLSHEVNQVVYKFDAFGNTTICNQTLNGTLLTFLCDVKAAGFGNETIQPVIYSDNQYAGTTLISSAQPLDYKGADIFIELLLVTSIVFLLISHPIMIIIGAIIGVLSSISLIFITQGSWTSIVAILAYYVVAGIIIIVYIARRL